MKSGPERSSDAFDLPADLSKPALRALDGAGYGKLEDLTRVSEAELLKLHGMGPKALASLRREMSRRGLEFRRGEL